MHLAESFFKVLLFSALKTLNRSSLLFIIFIVGSFCISAQTSTQFDTKLNIRSLATEMDVAYDPVENYYLITSGGSHGSNIIAVRPNLNNLKDGGTEILAPTGVNHDHRSTWYNENTQRIEGRGYAEGWGYFPETNNIVNGQNVQWDSNTSQPRANGMSSQDMPDYADHANEIINCTGTGDGNLTVRVYTPQGGDQIRTITLNNPPGTQSWAPYPVFYSGSESRLIGRFDKTNKRVYWWPYTGGNYSYYVQIDDTGVSGFSYGSWGYGFSNNRFWLLTNSNAYGFPMFSPGIIASDQIFCSGNSYDPALLTSTSSAFFGGATESNTTYQWQRSDTSSTTGFYNISGATTLTYDPGTVTQTTYFRRSATNTLTINSNVLTVEKFLITSQPSSSTQSLNQNQSSTALSVAASSSSGVTYQWYSNNSNSNSGGSSISGATNNSYTPPTNQTGTKYYYVIVTKSGCSITSDVSGRVSVGTPPTVSFNVATDSGNTIYTKYTPTKTVTITAQFSESLMSTPTLSISGLVTSVIMTPISATNSYTYLWNTSTPTIPAGDYFISASGRNNLGIYNTGVTSYTVTVSPTFYLDSNGVTIKCQNCSAGDTGMVGGTLYTAVENGNGTNGIQRLVNAGNYNIVTTLVTDMSNIFKIKIHLILILVLGIHQMLQTCKICSIMLMHLIKTLTVGMYLVLRICVVCLTGQLLLMVIFLHGILQV